MLRSVMDATPRLGPVGVWCSVHEIQDPEHFSQAVTGATLRAEFLGKTGTVAKIERFVGATWAMDFFESGVKARVCGPLIPGWASFCFIISARQSRWYGLEAEDGWLLCNPPGTPIDGTITSGFSGVSVAVPQDVWARCHALSRSEGQQSFNALRLPVDTATRIQSELREMHRCLNQPREQCGTCLSPSLWGETVARQVAEIAAETTAMKSPYKDSSRNRFRLARRAESWIHDHLTENSDIPRICHALGTSRRELEYAFQTAFGDTPRAYLESIRLNAVRRALKATPSSMPISEVATGFGFYHLGRFSGRFKKLFGESPSQIVRNDGSGSRNTARS